MFAFKKLLRPLYAPIVRNRRNLAKLKADQAAIRAQVEACLASGCPLKIIIGAGSTRYDGWIATDIPAFDILNGDHWTLLFQSDSIDRLLAEHVFEHLSTDRLGKFLRLARGYLASSGCIRFALPDGNHPDLSYIERVRPGGIGEGAADHKVLYDCDLIAKLLRKADYDFRLLEYFDEAGTFQRMPWQREDGFIGRSADNDPRNAKGDLVYTSLIVDCWPHS